MKIFLDANVLFTAAYNPSGRAHLLIDEFATKIITSDYADEEARKNIQAKKPEAMVDFKKLLSQITIVPSVNGTICPIALREKDRPIFLTALANKATHLLTGDKRDFGIHMNVPKKTYGIVIQTVRDFLDSFV